MQAAHLCYILQNLYQAQVNLLDATWIIVQRRMERGLCPAVPSVSSTPTIACLHCFAELIAAKVHSTAYSIYSSWAARTKFTMVFQIYSRVADFNENVPAPCAHQYLVC